MAQTQAGLRERVADETKISLGRITRRLEQAGASPVLLYQVRELSRAVARELGAGPETRRAGTDHLAQALTPPEVIRHAEQLIRRQFPVLHPLHAIWGKIADDLNEASHIPELDDSGLVTRAACALDAHRSLRGASLTVHLESAHQARFLPSALAEDPDQAVRVHRDAHPALPGQPHDLGPGHARWVRFNRAQALAWAVIGQYHGRANQDNQEGGSCG